MEAKKSEKLSRMEMMEQIALTPFDFGISQKITMCLSLILFFALV